MRHHDLQNFDTLNVSNIIDESDRYIIEADIQRVPECCPYCQAKAPNRHGTQQQRYFDVPMQGKPVNLRVDRARYRCNGCGKTFFSSLPGIDSKRRATTRFVKYIEQESLRRSFASLAGETGIDEKTVKNIFSDYLAKIEAEASYVTPRFLGINSLRIMGENRCLITNVDELTAQALLPKINPIELTRQFTTMPAKDNVEAVTMEMTHSLKDVVSVQFPNRDIIVDRRQVLKMANLALEVVRKRNRKGLNSRQRMKLKDDKLFLFERDHNLSVAQRDMMQSWFRQHPELELAYRTKESFHEIYACKSRIDAEEYAQDLIGSIPESIAFAFTPLKAAFSSWWGEIFNFYDHSIHNAYSGYIDRLARNICLMGRGYSFDVIRAIMIYDIREGSAFAKYGQHIPELCNRLESGYFRV